jgi:hypothetical protein
VLGQHCCGSHLRVPETRSAVLPLRLVLVDEAVGRSTRRFLSALGWLVAGILDAVGGIPSVRCARCVRAPDGCHHGARCFPGERPAADTSSANGGHDRAHGSSWPWRSSVRRAKTYRLDLADLGYRLRVKVTAKNAKGSTTATSALTTIVAPVVKITNQRPTLTIVSVRFSGSQVYARFRICDDSFKNLTIIETDSRPGKLSFTRRFSTLIAPRHCGVYTRHWLPAARFRGTGRYTATLAARDTSGLTSLPAHRSFTHG